MHTADHIMLKIPLPLATQQVQRISHRAREQWTHQDSNHVASVPPIERVDETSREPRRIETPHPLRSPSPTNETVYGGPGQRVEVSNAARRSTARQNSLDHAVPCDACQSRVMGVRYQCANCPSDPVGYNLVRDSSDSCPFYYELMSGCP